MVDSNPQMEPAQCPSYAAGLGYLGVAAAVCLSNWGSAVGLVLLCVSAASSATRASVLVPKKDAAKQNDIANVSCFPFMSQLLQRIGLFVTYRWNARIKTPLLLFLP